MVAAGAAKSSAKIFNLTFKPLHRAGLFTSSPAGGFRHDQPQLPLAGDVQDAVVVFDHIAQGLQVPFDEGAGSARCPSSDDLRQFACFRKGGSGSSVIEIMRRAVDAASDGLRLSGV